MTALERRIRIGDWLVPYDDAEQEVVIERTLADILRATPGSDLDCMNSRCIRAQRNRHVFPHPVLIVSTIRSRVYVVDKLDDSGLPAHAVRYELTARDSSLINAHDKLGAGEPGELRLRIPRDPKGSPRRASGRQAGRFAQIKKGHFSGEGKVMRVLRPVTSASFKGAHGRYVAAVGALKLDDDKDAGD
jgi:hypothetical protein